MARQSQVARPESALAAEQHAFNQDSMANDARSTDVIANKVELKAAELTRGFNAESAAERLGDKQLHGKPLQQATEIVERFKTLYQNFETTQQACLAADQLDDERLTLEQVYSQTVSFRDPLHEIKGLNDLRRYMQAMYGNVISCEFVYLDQWIAFDSASIKWDMVFKHRKLGGGKTITVRGISHVRFTDRIHYHEDVFDAGAMIYQQLPLLGRIISKIKSRLSV